MVHRSRHKLLVASAHLDTLSSEFCRFVNCICGILDGPASRQALVHRVVASCSIDQALHLVNFGVVLVLQHGEAGRDRLASNGGDARVLRSVNLHVVCDSAVAYAVLAVVIISTAAMSLHRRAARQKVLGLHEVQQRDGGHERKAEDDDTGEASDDDGLVLDPVWHDLVEVLVEFAQVAIIVRQVANKSRDAHCKCGVDNQNLK